MKKAIGLGLLVLVLAEVAQAKKPPASDDLCGHLAAFESAPMNQTGIRQSRWIELHWRGNWLNFETGWGFECLHSPDKAATDLCNWLPTNVSYEFPYVFGRDVLACHGYNVPRIEGWKGKIDLNDADDRFSYLVVNFDDLKDETGAIRLVSIGDKAVDPEINHRELSALPPLKQ